MIGKGIREERKRGKVTKGLTTRLMGSKGWFESEGVFILLSVYCRLS